MFSVKTKRSLNTLKMTLCFSFQ